jgi:hypothetical protein
MGTGGGVGALLYVDERDGLERIPSLEALIDNWIAGGFIDVLVFNSITTNSR